MAHNRQKTYSNNPPGFSKPETMEEQFKTFKNLCGICLSKAIGFRLGGFYNVLFFLVSMRAKGIVFSCYTTNSNVCPRNLKIPVRGFIPKIYGNTNSNKKIRQTERDSLLTVAA